MASTFFSMHPFLDIISEFFDSEFTKKNESHKYIYESFSEDPTQLITKAVRDSIDEVDSKREIPTAQKKQSNNHALAGKEYF